jgi:hypothetical protein
VEEAAWKLVWLARDLGDGGLAAFAGKLLALTGPLDASVIAFSVPTFALSTAAAQGAAPTAAPQPQQRTGRAAASQQVCVQPCILAWVRGVDVGPGQEGSAWSAHRHSPA